MEYSYQERILTCSSCMLITAKECNVITKMPCKSNKQQHLYLDPPFLKYKDDNLSYNGKFNLFLTRKPLIHGVSTLFVTKKLPDDFELVFSYKGKFLNKEYSKDISLTFRTIETFRTNISSLSIIWCCDLSTT